MWLNILEIIGGTGILLYGIEIMKSSLEKTSSGATQKMLKAMPKNIFTSIFTGIIITAINQKSTATTLMVVGIVNGGMMTLYQAAGVIMGANIGTTVTAQILAFRLEFIAPFILGAGALVWHFASSRKVDWIAEIFIGLGLMFLGMLFLIKGMNEINSLPIIRELVENLTSLSIFQYLVAILVGLVLTLILRSSTLITGIMIAMATTDLLSFHVAMPLILGLNIGKGITHFFSSRGIGHTAKRALVLNLIFNLIGTVLFVSLLTHFMESFVNILAPENIPRQIAYAHTFFNLGCTIILLPFVRILVRLTNKIVKKEKYEEGNMEVSLDVRMLDTPGLALAQAHKELCDMTNAALHTYEISMRALIEEDDRLAEQSKSDEDSVILRQREIEVYLVELSKRKLSEVQQKKLNLMLEAAGDIEQISDIASNTASLAFFEIEEGIRLSKEAIEELEEVHKLIMDFGNQTLFAMRKKDPTLLEHGFKMGKIEKELRDKHIARLSRGECEPGSGVLFLDVLSNMTRVVEHLKKVRQYINEVAKY